MQPKILHIRSVNDYARYIGAPVLHELVSVIHYDELTAMRHSRAMTVKRLRRTAECPVDIQGVSAPREFAGRT